MVLYFLLNVISSSPVNGAITVPLKGTNAENP